MCYGSDSNDYGYLVTSGNPEAFLPLTAGEVRMRLCLRCGALFGVRDQANPADPPIVSEPDSSGNRKR